MPTLDAYLTFDGTCAEAMRFYERTLGGKLETLMTHAESPMADQVPPASRDRILHARLVVDGRHLMASDSPAGQPYEGMHGFSLSLDYGDVAEARRVFDALADGGRVNMPLQKVFWADLFGMLVDRYGTPWMVNAVAAS
ncbi:MAG TPA: VOC family protein [Vicinamibacteria bacterium]|nr:VOC family protein [Vicinamibacteria bacterium]